MHCSAFNMSCAWDASAGACASRNCISGTEHFCGGQGASGAGADDPMAQPTKCIASARVCNKRADCADGSDEDPALCNTDQMEMGEADDYFGGDDGTEVEAAGESNADGNGGGSAGDTAAGSNGNANGGSLAADHGRVEAAEDSAAHARLIRIYVGGSVGGAAGVLLIVAAYLMFCTGNANGSVSTETGFTAFSKTNGAGTFGFGGGRGGGGGGEDDQTVANPLFKQEFEENAALTVGKDFAAVNEVVAAATSKGEEEDDETAFGFGNEE